MERSVSIVIYFYVFICIALLVFNVLYILRSKGKTVRDTKQIRKWLKELEHEWERVQSGELPSTEHRARLSKKLVRTEALFTYHEAVLRGMEQYSDKRVQCYLDDCYQEFLGLAVAYGKKPAMERAFFAYVISVYHPNREVSGAQFSRILSTYFEDSTVYCRENVLQALYAFGHIGSVERIFSMLNAQEIYHHSRLISDGLQSFQGDKQALAWLLWKKCSAWQEYLQVAVIQFAAGLSGEFAGEFLNALKDEGTNLEARFALVRYFRRWQHPEAEEYLQKLLVTNEQDLAIAAASVLEKYPGQKTYAALMEAVCSRNWYVRQNAAESLVALGCTMADVEILRGRDRYGAQMLEYKLRQRQETNVAATEERKEVCAV